MNGGWATKVGAALFVFSFAAVPGAASEEQHDHPAPLSEAAQLDPQVADVARRLWGDLVCLCDRCDRLTLSACHCPDAAAERKTVLALLRGRDLAAPGGAEAAYQAVVSDYVQRKGRKVLASVRTYSPPADWPALAISVGIMVLACVAVAANELRRKRARRSGRGSRR